MLIRLTKLDSRISPPLSWYNNTFFSCWIYKTHPPTRLLWIFWCFCLLEVPNWILYMKTKLWNILCETLTDFYRHYPIQLLRLGYLVYINTPFLNPIMIFQWNLEITHNVTHGRWDLDNFSFSYIFLRRMRLCCIFIYSMQPAVFFPYLTNSLCALTILPGVIL